MPQPPALEHKITLKLEWQNKKEFHMNEDDGTEVQIVKVEENGHIALIWPQVEEICKRYFAAQLEKIGTEMKLQ